MMTRLTRRIRLVQSVAILWFVTGAGSPPAAGQVSTELSTQVESLVRLLADDDPHVRDDAERQLLALGAKALPLVPRPSTGATPDIRLRLSRVRNRLHRDELDDTVRPSRVTLQGEMTVEEALRAIESQTGNRVLVASDPGRDRVDDVPLSLHLRDVPFWEAMNTLLQTAHLQLEALAGQPNALSLRSAPAPRRESGHHGPLSDGDSILRGEVLRVARIKDWRQTPREVLRLEVALTWEPRLSPLELRFANRELSATDDLGNVLKPIRSSGHDIAIVSVRSSGIPRSWQFDVPSHDATHLKSITAQVDMLLTGPIAPFVFTHLDRSGQPPLQQQPGVAVAVEEIRRKADSYEILVSVEYDRDSPAFESHRVWIYDNPVFLQDEQGVTTKPVSKEVVLQQGPRFVLAFRFDVPDLRGQALHYATPRTCFSAQIPIEFRDIPLP